MLYRDTPPHAGYEILSRLAAGRTSFVFTSNVDGHFARAGFSPDQILECHGSIHHFQCTAPCTETVWDAEDSGLQVDEATMRAGGTFPRRRACGELARPNVLMFDNE